MALEEIHASSVRASAVQSCTSQKPRPGSFTAACILFGGSFGSLMNGLGRPTPSLASGGSAFTGAQKWDLMGSGGGLDVMGAWGGVREREGAYGGVRGGVRRGRTGA